MAPYHYRPYEDVIGTNGGIVQHLMATGSDGLMIPAIVFYDLEGGAGGDTAYIEGSVPGQLSGPVARGNYWAGADTKVVPAPSMEGARQ